MLKKKIFIVEDEVIVATDIERRLQQLDYTISGMSTSGKEAIQKIEESKPDLVLMDIVLDGKLNGIETARIL